MPTTGRSGKGRPVETVKGSGVARGWGEGGVSRGNPEAFRAVTLLGVTRKWWGPVLTRLSKPTEHTPRRVSPNINPVWALGHSNATISAHALSQMRRANAIKETGQIYTTL